MRWAVFKDFRGVVYCEPVDEGLMVFEKFFPARPAIKTWWGKVIHPAREAETRQHIQFDDRLKSRDQYFKTAFDPPPRGYKRSPTRVYIQYNLWGPVEALFFIKDDKVGRRLQYAFRRLSPERSHKVKDRDNNASPHPDTDRIIDRARLLAA